MPIELTYWSFKGRAEYLIWLLKYLGPNHSINLLQGPQQWREARSRLTPRNPLLSLPYIINSAGDVIAEPPAITLDILLDNKKELLGKNTIDIVLIRSMQDTLATVINFCFELLKLNRFELDQRYKKDIDQNVVQKVHPLGFLMGEESRFVLGYVSVVDFGLSFIVEILDFIERRSGLKNPLSHFERLYNVRGHVFELDGVKGYVQSKEAKEKKWFPEDLLQF